MAPSSLTTPMREVKKRRGSRKSRDEYVRGVSFYDRNPLIEILRRNICLNSSVALSEVT